MTEGLTGAVREMVARRFGGPCYVATHFGVVAGTNQFATSNPERVWVAFVNTGASQGWLDINEAPSASRGIPLLPNGGYVVFDVDADAVMPAQPFYLNNYAGAANSIYVMEVIRIRKVDPGGI